MKERPCQPAHFPFEDRRFLVQGLAPGKYRVRVFVPNESGRTEVEVDVGKGEQSIVIPVEKD